MTKCLHISKEFEGRYVALKDENDPVVVGSGATPEEALRESQANGYEQPLFLYVPEAESVFIY